MPTKEDTPLPPAEQVVRMREAGEAMSVLLKSASCPNCDGRGWYAEPSMPDGEPEQVQCQWCYEYEPAIRSWDAALLPVEGEGSKKVGATTPSADKRERPVKAMLDLNRGLLRLNDRYVTECARQIGEYIDHLEQSAHV